MDDISCRAAGSGCSGERNDQRQKQTGLLCIESALLGKISRQGFSFGQSCDRITLGLKKPEKYRLLAKKRKSPGKF